MKLRSSLFDVFSWGSEHQYIIQKESQNFIEREQLAYDINFLNLN